MTRAQGARQEPDEKGASGKKDRTSSVASIGSSGRGRGPRGERKSRPKEGRAPGGDTEDIQGSGLTKGATTGGTSPTGEGQRQKRAGSVDRENRKKRRTSGKTGKKSVGPPGEGSGRASLSDSMFGEPQEFMERQFEKKDKKERKGGDGER